MNIVRHVQAHLKTQVQAADQTLATTMKLAMDSNQLEEPLENQWKKSFSRKRAHRILIYCSRTKSPTNQKNASRNGRP
jgi:hypothetical protein